MINNYCQKILSSISKYWVLAIVYIPILWTLSFNFTFPNGRSIASKLLVISAIFSFIYFRKRVFIFKEKPKTFKILITSLFIIILFRSILFLYHGEQTSSIRAFGIIFLYIYSFPYWLVKKEHIKNITFISLFLFGLDAFIHVINNGFTRYGGNTNPNPYGLYAALIFIFVYIYNLINTKTHTLYKTIPLIIIGLLPIMISQSRGVWVSTILTLIIIHIARIKFNIKNISIYIFTILAIAFSLYSTPTVKNRIEATKIEIKNIEHHNLSSSLGVRIQVWKDSIPLIKEYPFFGLGNKLKEINNTRFENKEISQYSYYYSRNHLHSQYFEFITKQGFIGFFIIIGTIIFPLIIMRKDNDIFVKFCSISFLCILLINFITEVPFNWINFTYTYLILILCLTLQSYRSTKDIRS
ncbi:O-antigen ligase family protein [Aliivibrio fischeri]|uniref:O-antigen ligase family protein n=1 Tax=Aliivibrio fischeri TaxID=668 RepID=UPI00080EA422|nr:O-antigen ligase family protein [Aliivibrio fischeri]OCH39946.1 hypothetical protein A6D99_07320 [Aliivibrio fischeri]